MTAVQISQDAKRKGLIAKIHVAKKEMALTECSYRALLEGATDKDSCADMNIKELETVLDTMKKFGFKVRRKPQRAGSRSMADDQQARKIRAYWLMLYHLGEIADPSEEALAGFVERMTKAKAKALQWLSNAQVTQVMNALRGWLTRVGFYHPEAADIRWLGGYVNANHISLINQQAHILGIQNIYEWMADNGYGKDTLLQHLDESEQVQIIEILGNKVRQGKGK